MAPRAPRTLLLGLAALAAARCTEAPRYTLALASTITNATALKYAVEARIYPEDPHAMYITNRGGGVSMWDISNPAAPRVAAFWAGDVAGHTAVRGVEGQDRLGDLLVVAELGDTPNSALITLNATSLDPLARAPLDVPGALHCKLYRPASQGRTYAILTTGLTHNTTARRRLVAVDVSDPRRPRQVASVEVWAGSGCSEGVSIVGDVAFIGSYCTNDVATVSLSALPDSLTVTRTGSDPAYENMVSASYDSSYNASSAAARPSSAAAPALLFSASYASPGGLVIFNGSAMADSGEMEEVGRLITPNTSRANRAHVRADLRVALLPLEKGCGDGVEKGCGVGGERGGLALVDISSPARPSLILSMPIPSETSRSYTIASRGEYVYSFGTMAHELYVYRMAATPSAARAADGARPKATPPVTALRTVRFSGSSASIANPERGFRAELVDFPAMARLDALRQFNLTLAQAYCYLTQFCTTTPCQPLSAAFLDAMSGGFARARRAGVKLLLRFGYENSSAHPQDGPSSYAEIFAHMRQLQPLIHANADVIHALAAGFVGAYGEWHSSAHGLEQNTTGLAALVAAELDWFLPADRTVIIRAPRQKTSLLRTWAATLPSAHARETLRWCIAGPRLNRSAPCFRLGYDNDGFAAGTGDGGTWATAARPYGAVDNATGVELPMNLPGNPEFDYMSAEAPWLLIDGEPYAHNKGCRPAAAGLFNPMCARGAEGATTHEAGGAVSVRLRNHHYTSFSFARNCEWLRAIGEACKEAGLALDFWRNSTLESATVNEWKLPHSPQYPVSEASHLRYLTDHIGYRLELTAANVPASVPRGGAIRFNATLINRGFAAPMNPRPVLAVLLPPAAGATAAPIVLGAIDVDVREWQPYLPGDPYYYAVEHTLSLPATTLPAAVGAGTWQLGLHLPDARASAQDDDARFSIRLANEGVPWWTAGTRYGVNVIASVSVTA